MQLCRPNCSSPITLEVEAQQTKLLCPIDYGGWNCSATSTLERKILQTKLITSITFEQKSTGNCRPNCSANVTLKSDLLAQIPEAKHSRALLSFENSDAQAIIQSHCLPTIKHLNIFSSSHHYKQTIWLGLYWIQCSSNRICLSVWYEQPCMVLKTLQFLNSSN